MPALNIVVPNADTVKMAWVGPTSRRPKDASLLTLQSALNLAAAGDTVSFDVDDYIFAKRLTVPRRVELTAARPSTLFAQLTVTGGGLSDAANVMLGVSATGAAVTVSSSDAVLDGITVVNPNGVLRPTGIQLGATATGVIINDFQMDGGDQASSYGVNLTTGSATINDANVAGVATGVVVTAASTATGIAVVGGKFSAQNVGIALGAASSPTISSVTVTGTATGTGIDLANSSAAHITSPVVTDFARGIAATPTSTATGPTITDATVTGANREGIALGSTTGATLTTPTVIGDDTAQSIGIQLYRASGVTLNRITVSRFAYGVYTNIADTGTGPNVISPVVSAVSLGGITLGSTQGATITRPHITGTGSGTGINTMNAGRVTISDALVTNFTNGIAAQSNIDPTSDRVNYSLTNIDVRTATTGSTAISLLGTVNATITNVTADMPGTGIVLHETTTTKAEHIIVTGHAGVSSTTGAAILRAYDSTAITVNDSSIDAGSYGVFFSSSDNATITDARVSGVSEYALYGRSVSHLSVSGSTLTNNAAVGNLVVTTAGSGISHDINIHDNTMTGNTRGLNLYTGTSNVTFAHNTVSGQRYVVSAAPAHGVTIANNTITQTGATDEAAVMVTPLYEDGDHPGSYSSSGITVSDNVFHGDGTWVQVGSPDASTPDAARRTVSTPVLVIGNTFPGASTAIRTFANAVEGEDSAAAVAVAAARRAVTGPVAVDARDYDDPNDWGSPCRATGYLDGELVYDGQGAIVDELTDALVLYPTNCITLSLVEALTGPTGTVYHVGDIVTWTLTAHNGGPRSAPAGWSITPVLPTGVTLESMTGAGYSVTGLTAVAAEELPVGADGPPLTVHVRIMSAPSATATSKNVAYVSPPAAADATDTDGDGYVDSTLEYVKPLVIPTLTTDTDQSVTDNDAQGFWTVAGVTPTPTPTPAAAGPDDSLAFTGGVDSATASSLADTGVPVAALAVAALAAALAGTLLIAYRARRHSS
ncbi:right-handed parallel beta-helix repeat-containing protein [Jatrophihabitans sp. GAS493]|uniref:right-handed parallel beta-helix repeat-containing protein n=1 Tax=Jatrophihabitans sp. GAS493 TaxID=1907575 RepID=UPI0015608872|nr:right-handed parallel beta-helix repeat-containing protein [Jatrophihabitans sp. GAS493]